ncbi:uncharacterized protein L201_003517 [Kwoniella dendrophila CBS 6074]|uniref:Uncharacterized protein n=1 Tax=Kwoniella dendrophila CBS 6074 TaxID=1295534 RepID=A0AAX4JTF3_9TREE
MQWFSKSKGPKGGVGDVDRPGKGDGEIGRPRLAVAHFMLGNTYPFTEEDWIKTFDLAQDTGLDALALNLGPEEWQLNQASIAYRIVRSSEYKLKLFLSLDLMVLPKDPELLIDKVTKIIESGKKSQLKWDKDRIVLSTFGGHELGDKSWEKVIREVGRNLGEKVFFIPSFFLPPEEILEKNYVDGAFHWNGAWPMGNHTVNLDSDKPFLKHKKPYMASVSPLFFTHYGTEGEWAWNKNWIYRSDDLLLPTRFLQLLSLPPWESPEMLQIISWNDFGESHYIGPILGAQPGSEDWTNGMNHEGFKMMTKYFIKQWKDQVQRPPSTKNDNLESTLEADERGKMIVWYRTQSKNMLMAEDHVGKPDHSEWAQDLLNFFIILPGSKYSLDDKFTLHVQNGDVAHEPIIVNVGSSVNLIPIPFKIGKVYFEILKNNKEIIIQGKGKEIKDGGRWNYNMWSGVFDAIS